MFEISIIYLFELSKCCILFLQKHSLVGGLYACSRESDLQRGGW